MVKHQATAFYNFFWSDIKIVLTQSIQYAMSHSELSIEQKRGIIKLITFKELEANFTLKYRLQNYC